MNHDIVILGLSITSSWGNGHATTFRGLVKALHARGHRILFLERDVPWYAANRDDPQPPGATTVLYRSIDELQKRFAIPIGQARLVIIGSYVPDGIAIAEWVRRNASGAVFFYDIDTPVTLAALENRSCEYLTPELIPQFDAYLSFTGGPILRTLEHRFRARRARVLYCSVDAANYHPREGDTKWDLGYLGTYTPDRQNQLEELLLRPARLSRRYAYCVAGPMYPEGEIDWPRNVERIEHLSPQHHADFYASQRFTLNITRAEMRRHGYAPSVRLFEAGACAVPVISDWWTGLDHLFDIGREILIADCADDVLRYLRDIPEPQRREIGARARTRIQAEHTPEQRALQLEAYLEEIDDHAATHTARHDGRGGPLDSRVVARL